MEFLDIVAILLSLAAIFSFLNYKFLKLPMVIGVMLISLAVSLSIMLLGIFIPDLKLYAVEFVEQVHFDTTLMNGMLSCLLFAGALHVKLSDLKDQKWIVSAMASFGVALSTFIIGTLSYYVFQLFSIEVHLLWCYVFGALISPTDPVAVLGILKSAGAPKSLETKITGESLFNDGVGVVIYIALVGIAYSATNSIDNGHAIKDVSDIVHLFVVEAGGGILLGLILGGIGYKMLKSIDNYHIEILITLALVTAGYRIAIALHTSGPLAMVVAGLLTGNPLRNRVMSESTKEHLDTFWGLIDDVLNAVLFLLIGIEILQLSMNINLLAAGLTMIPLCLLSRLIATWIPVQLISLRRGFTPGVVKILTWGGIRGGISVALALGIPKDVAGRGTIIVATYIIVIFSIAVQGLTLKSLIQKNITERPN